MTILPPESPPRRRGCATRLIALLLIAFVGFAGFQAVGLAVDDLRWLRDRALAEAEALVGDQATVSDGMDGHAGSGGDGYSFSAVQPDGVSPVTWPCEGTIRIEINPEGAPEGHAELVAEAVDRINAASGFTFEIVGQSDDRDFLDRRPGPVLLGFADADEVEHLDGPIAGVGGSLYASAPGESAFTSVGGMVVLDEAAFGRRMSDATAEAIIMHELAHVLGLGHTDARGQLMRGTNTFQVDFGEGDRAGLTALREHACS
ncbi:MAG: matrixin family metalloprotease [Intrasporangiaceae bacterium]|nr:matrixin family metalloprotease [Intrasporangiaceae bacterium]